MARVPLRVVLVKNLTREQAQLRAALLTVASYDVHLDLTGADGFDSTTTIRFGCAAPGAGTFVELDAELVSATGVKTGAVTGNRIELLDLAADNTLVVRARCAYSNTGEGLHRFTDPADGRSYLWAMSFLDDAQRMFACFDQPDLKASITLTVDAAPDDTVVANARGSRQGDRWSFVATEPMSTYAFTVAAGPWHSVHRHIAGESLGSKTLGLHCRQSLAEHLDADADELFEVTEQCFALQEQLLGRAYPWGDTYDQLFVPEFNHGAMENPGAVTFTESFIFRSRVTDDARRKRAMVIAHEMAHMWFGDLVTMSWWDDLWLNESFAELMGFLTVDRATRFEGTWVDFTASRKAWGYRADQLPSTHPVQGDVADSRSALLNFDGISYAKGASVLRQLMATIGEDAFFAGVRAYLDRHAWGNTVFADLLGELETASGRDLQQWAADWLQTSGTSTLRVLDGALASDGRRPHRVGVGLYDRTSAGLELRERLELDVTTSTPLFATADLVLPNDGDLTFAKIRLDERSLATVLSDLRHLGDPLARALCWAALWDACRDAELPATDFVRAVLGNVGGEQDPAVVTTLLAQARTAAVLFTDGPGLRAELAEASARAVWAGDAGDLQLVHARAYTRVADGVGQAGRLESLLAGQDVPPGLLVDTELRWTLVQSLAALGRLTDQQIDAELERDATSAGQLSAATARAALPDPATKERAWVAAAHDLLLSNAEAHALARGFWQFGQDELLAPYVERYVAELPGLWATRSPEVVGRLTELLFPSTVVRQAVLDRTQLLLGAEHPAGLRRLVGEQRDDLHRALACRAVR